MKLIFRPLTPPSSLTFLKYAAMVLPIVPYADALPLYGLVLPILISVGVTPTTVWAVAPPATRPVDAEADDEGQEPLGWTHGALPFEWM